MEAMADARVEAVRMDTLFRKKGSARLDTRLDTWLDSVGHSVGLGWTHGWTLGWTRLDAWVDIQFEWML